MDLAALTRMQIRAVLTAFRSENLRLRRLYPRGGGADARRRLSHRSVELLDNARARLDGEAIRHPELLDEIESAREVVGGEVRPEVSVGARGDRPG
jgi:hypothetical protein